MTSELTYPYPKSNLGIEFRKILDTRIVLPRPQHPPLIPYFQSLSSITHGSWNTVSATNFVIRLSASYSLINSVSESLSLAEP